MVRFDRAIIVKFHYALPKTHKTGNETKSENGQMAKQDSFKHHLDEVCDMLEMYGGRDKVICINRTFTTAKDVFQLFLFERI